VTVYLTPGELIGSLPDTRADTLHIIALPAHTRTNTDPADTVLYVGLEPGEQRQAPLAHRIPADAAPRPHQGRSAGVVPERRTEAAAAVSLRFSHNTFF
jgi:hypothetical protein